MILGRAKFISANPLDFFYIVLNLLAQIANFLRVCAELISANFIQIDSHFLIPHSFILALFSSIKVATKIVSMVSEWEAMLISQKIQNN